MAELPMVGLPMVAQQTAVLPMVELLMVVLPMVELLTVVAIIAVLAAIALPNFYDAQLKARFSELQVLTPQARDSVVHYFEAHDLSAGDSVVLPSGSSASGSCPDGFPGKQRKVFTDCSAFAVNLEFFNEISTALPANILVVLAEKDDMPIAAAVFFIGSDVLYGRYWGSDGHYDALHFETCYHQGIEYCIENGLSLFEPGTQGEHKISRGFTPKATWSNHWILDPEFGHAVAEFLDREREHVEAYMDELAEHAPYRRGVAFPPPAR